ncbi:hypothetical protein EON67_09890 [archaeon]|nr:MAG: hypothetical protein EON67_09890 [archaeon]
MDSGCTRGCVARRQCGVLPLPPRACRPRTRAAVARAGHAYCCLLADLLPIHALDLFHFRTQADVDAFQVTTDKVLGGVFVCVCVCVCVCVTAARVHSVAGGSKRRAPSRACARVLAVRRAGRTDATFTLKQYNHFNAGLFQGSINFQDDNPASRGGFASFRTKPSERARDLSAFEAFELRIKTDGRPYVAPAPPQTPLLLLLLQTRGCTRARARAHNGGCAGMC